MTRHSKTPNHQQQYQAFTRAGYSSDIRAVTSVNLTTCTVTMESENVDQSRGDFYLQGAVELLDQEGEWAVKGGIVYFWSVDSTNNTHRHFYSDVLRALNLDRVGTNTDVVVTVPPPIPLRRHYPSRYTYQAILCWRHPYLACRSSCRDNCAVSAASIFLCWKLVCVACL